MTTAEATQSDRIFRATSLDVGYRDGRHARTVLSNLNLSLHSGKMVCLMGANGSGKSTLIRTIAGLQPPLNGSFTYGDPEKFASRDLPAFVSVVLTDRVPSVNLTVRELITYGRYPHLNWSIRHSPDDIRHVENAIENLRLRELEHRPVYELSDGQLQMAVIARTLAQDTPVILLDEPTAHLDLNNRVDIMNRLRALAHQANKAILISTHDLDLALQTADLIWLAGSASQMIEGVPEDLVLNGAFDEIFKFKRFDLKTGKVQHEITRPEAIDLTGDGYLYRWTRGALERNGYAITNHDAVWRITIIDGQTPRWQLFKMASQYTREVATIKELLEQLQTIAAN